MRRAVSILALIIASSSLFAAYSIVTPESSDGMYMLMNAVGETLPLDDDLYYKEWNGLLAEQLNTGIYKVRDIRKMSPEDKFGIKLGTRDVMTTYRNGIFDKEFMDKFRTVATDILDPEVPFKQTVYRDKCVYCPFAEACGRD